MSQERLIDILNSAAEYNKDPERFPPTEIYNEGWMLRLVLDALETPGIKEHPLKSLNGARWYSEARLTTPFRPRKRGDRMGETLTRADAVIGHFDFRDGTKAGLKLASECSQFVVVEAKMFSPLSSGTKNAQSWNQAARTVACMAEMIRLSKVPLAAFTEKNALGFYLVAPEKQLKKQRKNSFANYLDRADLTRAFDRRMRPYGSDPKTTNAFSEWKSIADGLVDRMIATDTLKALSWEELIKPFEDNDQASVIRTGNKLRSFYDLCLDQEDQRIKQRTSG